MGGIVWYVVCGMVRYFHGMVWLEMERYGVIRYGRVLYGTAWYGAVLYGTVRYFSGAVRDGATSINNQEQELKEQGF